MKFKSDIEVQAGLKDSSGAIGSLGQVLSSTASGVSWTSPFDGITGSGTADQLARFTSSKSIGNSIVYDNGNFVIVGTGGNTGNIKFQVNGNARVRNELWLESTINKGAYVYTLPNNSGTFALLSDLSGFVTLNTAQTITGVKTFTSNLLLNVAPITGRESLLVGSVSDNLVDKFILANGTTTSSRFIPTFVGYTEGDYQSLLFRGLSSTSYDLSSNPPYIQFLAANTNNSTDPNNGVLSTPSSRDLFSWSTTGGTDYMKIAAGGNVLIGISTNSGDKLQINGNVLANGYKVPSGTNAQILAANGSVITAGTGISISGGTISSTVVGGVTSFNTRTGAVTLTSTDVNTALGYTAADDSQVVKLTGNQTIAGEKTFNSINILELGSYFKHIVSPLFSTGYTTLAGISTGLLFGIDSSKIAKLAINNLTQEREYLLPNKDGSIALTSDLHNPVTISISNGLSINTNQQLSLGLANSSVNGALSSTDWNTFNSKQNQLNGNGFVRMSGTTPSYITGNQDQYVKADGSLSTAINSRVEVNFTATSGQTTFTTPYEVGQIDVYYNGSKLNPSEFTATNGTTVVLAQAATLNAQISIVKYIGSINGSSGTTNRVAKFTGTVTLGDSQIYDNGTNVGIGTTSPTNYIGYRTLSLNNTSGAALELKVNDTSALKIFSDDSQSYLYESRNMPLWFATNSTERMRITSGGNILIGTTTDAGFKLDVNGTGRFSSTITGQNNAVFQNTSTNILNIGTDQNMYGGTNSDGGVFVYGNNKLHLSTNSVRRLTIDGSGKVGIGTTSPANILQATDNLGSTTDSSIYRPIANFYSGANSSAFGLTIGSRPVSGNTNQGGYIQSNSSVTYRSGFDHIFQSGSGFPERMRITDAGDIVMSQARSISIDLNSTPAGGSAKYWRINNNSANGTFRIQQITNGGGMYLDANNPSGGWFGISDERQKNDLGLIEYGALDKIMSLKARRFTFKTQAENASPSVGFFAQEIIQHLPETITKIEEEDGEVLTYNSNFVIPYLVKAMQEQQELIQELTARLEILENK
jgi:hypothetical protein